MVRRLHVVGQSAETEPVQGGPSDQHPHTGANPLFHDHVVCSHTRVSDLNVNDANFCPTGSDYLFGNPKLTGGQ